MPKIIQLDHHIADLIAAGEVVSRPASVVKELLENSIDAGAGIITAEITAGGMTFIRITDNGCGIGPDDVETAFLRHATSKLRNAADLEAIQTLGFRGEALAAIAAVSRIELLTRTLDNENGTRLVLEGGDVKMLSPVGCPVGTSITVRDLFYNTPARQKFMKSDRAEGSAISSCAGRVALSRPDISFRYIKDGKTEFHTPGDSKAQSCIYSVLGRDMESGFIPVICNDEQVTVEGFISRPDSSRGNRNYQFFFLNGRVIRSVLLQTALEQAYKHMLTSNCFPACVLYINTKPGSVDVNVHPAKTEVRFISDKQVFDAVYYSVLSTLTPGAPDRATAPGTASVLSPSILPDTPAKTSAPAYPPPVPGAAGHAGTSGYPCADGRPSIPGHSSSIGHTRSAGNSSAREIIKPPAITSRVSEPDTSYLFDIRPLRRVIGEIWNTYIIVEADDTLWYIDKHAAHERIHYNALISGSYTPMSETLLAPVICKTGHNQTACLIDNAPLLDTLGFTVESFGDDAVAVRHIPSDINQSDVESVLSEIAGHLDCASADKTALTEACLDNIYKSLACKAAIKAGRHSEISELEELADAVLSGEISHCPHGRPVAVDVAKTNIAKLFKRI